MLYSYIGIRGADKKVKGQIAAKDENEAKHKLEGLAVHDAELKPVADLHGAEYFLFSDMGKAKLKPRDMAYFYEQMSFLQVAGMSLNESVDILTQSSNVDIAKLAFRIRPDVVSGIPIDEALRKTGLFSDDTIAKIAAGRDAGRMSETFSMLAVSLRKKIETKSKVISSLTYPAFMVGMLVIVLIAMLGFVVPSIAETIMSMGVELPLLTQIVMAMSDFIVTYGIFILIGIIILVVIHMTLKKRVDRYRYVMHKFQYKMPLLGKMLLKMHIQDLSETLAQLLHSGITIADALSITARTVKNDCMREALTETWQKVALSGYDIFAAMKEVGFFPGDYVQMVMIGSKAGNLESLLDNVSKQYSLEVEENLKRVTSLIEPLAIVGVALIGGVIIISLYLPMFSIFEAL